MPEMVNLFSPRRGRLIMLDWLGQNAIKQGAVMSDVTTPKEKVRSGSGFLTLAHVRDLSVVALIVVVGTRFATADFNIDLKDFSFTDLVSLFLAVSSVALSALFYFKADESSRTFYTHTYKFTKEVSEMLGRIDSGFGEKLTNIGQGYSDLSRKFDRFSYDPTVARTGEESSEAKKAEIQEQEAMRQDIIEDLMRRASVAGEEKEKLLDQLSTLSAELERSKAELQKQKSNTLDRVDASFIDYLSPYISSYFSEKYRSAPDELIRVRFARVLADPGFGSSATAYMQTEGLLFGDRLTDDGISLVRSIIRNVRKS